VAKGIEKIAYSEGLGCSAGRDVPFGRIDDRRHGQGRRAQLPHVFLAAQAWHDMALDRRALSGAQRIEHELGRSTDEGGCYFRASRAATLVYKGMIHTNAAVPVLHGPAGRRVESALAVVHSRFLEQHVPSWPLGTPHVPVIDHQRRDTTPVRANRNGCGPARPCWPARC